MREIGFKPYDAKAAFFIWTPLPKGYENSEDFINKVWKEKKVLLMPGRGFGKNGEGFFRVSTTSPMEKIFEGINRLKGIAG